MSLFSKWGVNPGGMAGYPEGAAIFNDNVWRMRAFNKSGEYNDYPFTQIAGTGVNYGFPIYSKKRNLVYFTDNDGGSNNLQALYGIDPKTGQVVFAINITFTSDTRYLSYSELNDKIYTQLQKFDGNGANPVSLPTAERGKRFFINDTLGVAFYFDNTTLYKVDALTGALISSVVVNSAGLSGNFIYDISQNKIILTSRSSTDYYTFYVYDYALNLIDILTIKGQYIASTSSTVPWVCFDPVNDNIVYMAKMTYSSTKFQNLTLYKFDLKGLKTAGLAPTISNDFTSKFSSTSVSGSISYAPKCVYIGAINKNLLFFYMCDYTSTFYAYCDKNMNITITPNGYAVVAGFKALSGTTYYNAKV